MSSRNIFLPIIAIAALISCGGPALETAVAQGPKISSRDDLRAVYDSVHVNGCFIMHDVKQDQWVIVDSIGVRTGSLPASSYKVLGSLIALEEGVVPDEHTQLPWDSVQRRPDVDHDLDLADALKYSAYWFHRDVARRIGADRLKYHWDRVGYGNADTSGGFDKAWVMGNLKVTPREQVDMLERLWKDELPFSKANMAVVKRIMIQEDTLGYVLHGKTGWADLDTLDIGWFVGWVERADSTGPFIFANRITCADKNNQAFKPARRETALGILRRLDVLP